MKLLGKVLKDADLCFRLYEDNSKIPSQIRFLPAYHEPSDCVRRMEDGFVYYSSW